MLVAVAHCGELITVSDRLITLFVLSVIHPPPRGVLCNPGLVTWPCKDPNGPKRLHCNKIKSNVSKMSVWVGEIGTNFTMNLADVTIPG